MYNNTSSKSINKLYLYNYIIYLQDILKIKKIKLKKGRVQFIFHSLYYDNYLIMQYFEMNLPGTNNDFNQRTFLENELNSKKWYHDWKSIFWTLIIIFIISYSLEIYLMQFIKMVILIDSETSQFLLSYLNNNVKIFGNLANFIQFFKIL